MQNMLIKRFFGICIVFLSLNSLLFAQNDDVSITYHQSPDVVKDTVKPFFKDDILRKIAVGGWLGLQFAGSYIYVGISPDISYHFNDWVAVGVGGTYNFAYDNQTKSSFHEGGPRAFVEGHFFNYIGLHAAYQALNFEDFYATSQSLFSERVWAHNLLMGGGYYRRMGRASVYFYILYCLSDKEILNNRVEFKAGFNVFLK
jgi:hypothetical protein